jgi:hypothetical protein
MTQLSEVAKMPKIYTDAILHCPMCNKNSNFVYIVKKDEDKYYLGEKCSNVNCDHYNDFKIIPSRLAENYPTPQK